MSDSWFPDRRVHAVLSDGSEIVRYNRAGKWYREWPNGVRARISIASAVFNALRHAETVHFGCPGGSRFDAALRKAEGPKAHE